MLGGVFSSASFGYEKLKDIKSVNDLIKQGYKLISTSTYTQNQGDGEFVYNLKKGDDLITCVLQNPKGKMLSVQRTYCFRP